MKSNYERMIQPGLILVETVSKRPPDEPGAYRIKWMLSKRGEQFPDAAFITNAHTFFDKFSDVQKAREHMATLIVRDFPEIFDKRTNKD